MMKLVVVLWMVFFGALGGIIWLGNNVPDEDDDSIVHQYKIVINPHTTADAKDETIQESVNLIEETINQVEDIVPVENKEANDGSI